MAMAGCGGKRPVAVSNVPPPPSAAPAPESEPPVVTVEVPPAAPAADIPTRPPKPAPSVVEPEPEPEIVVPDDAKVLYSETGWASWYGPGFQHRQTANGESYDMNRMTAAHRTIPLNSIVRVTNTKTGNSALLRITDRGPFVGNRIIDLSRAAAQKIDVYQHGTAMVKIEVLQAPSPIASGGRWCVQIGAFENKAEAARLKAKLARRYHTARVLQFSSPVGGDWLRILVADDDRKRAEQVIKETHTDAGVFLVRID